MLQNISGNVPIQKIKEESRKLYSRLYKHIEGYKKLKKDLECFRGLYKVIEGSRKLQKIIQG